MKSKKWMDKYILPSNLTNKIFENAIRIFEPWVTRPQTKALKTVLRWLRKNSTTIISHIHTHTIETKKFIEKISNHLWNIDIIKTVEKKAKLCIQKTMEENKKEWNRNIIAYDESDIFKPDAKCMPWLSRVRDWSTGLTWNWYITRWVNVNWYITRWVNVNWISLYSHLEEVLDRKGNKWEKTIETIKKVQIDLWKQAWLYLMDRWADDIKVINFLVKEEEKFIIRMKKNRNLVNLKNWKTTKITWFKQWKHNVKIWETEVILHVYKKPWRESPILLITNDKVIGTKETVVLYLKRWKVEEDFKKMKELWLEEIRLLNFMKIKNLIAMIQFIIILWQDMYEKVVDKVDPTYEHIYLYFKNFTKRKSLTQNPTSFIKFISFSLEHYDGYNVSLKPEYWLFWGKKEMKKLGMI